MSTPRFLSVLVVASISGVMTCAFEWETLDATQQATTFLDSSEGTLCGKATSVDLMAGRHTVVGEVTAWNDDVSLYVEYTTQPGWLLKATHLAIAEDLSGVPTNRAGNPRVGRFPFRARHRPPVDSVTYVVALADLSGDDGAIVAGDMLVIAAHAVVVQLNRRGKVIERESAWAQGDRFTRRNWAMYFWYPVQACQNVTVPEFVTYTQEQWNDPEGTAGQVLDDYFGQAFPGGLVAGATMCGPTVRFTSPESIREFLPVEGESGFLDYFENEQALCGEDGGTWEAETSTCVDPLSTAAGPLLAQIVALSLNVGIDEFHDGFSGSDVLLRDMIYNDIDAVASSLSTLHGKPVWDILNRANMFLSPVCSVLPADYVTVLDNINANFADSEIGLGYLVAP